MQGGGPSLQDRLFAQSGVSLPTSAPMETGGPWDFGGTGANPDIAGLPLSDNVKGIIKDMSSSFNLLNLDAHRLPDLGIMSLVLPQQFGTEFGGLFGKPIRTFGDPLNENSQKSWVGTLLSNGSKNGLFSSRQQ